MSDMNSPQSKPPSGPRRSGLYDRPDRPAVAGMSPVILIGIVLALIIILALVFLFVIK